MSNDVPPMEDSLTPEFPPGLFVEDVGDVTFVPPQPPPAPIPAVSPPPGAPLQPEKKSPRLLIAGAIVVVVAAAVTLLLVFQPWISTSSVEQDFNDAAGRYQQLQATLAQKITDAESTLALEAQTADPTVLDRLSTALNDGRSKVGSVPAMAENRLQIKKQTAELTSQSQACDAAITALDQAVQAVTASRIQYATDRLNEAVASAQTVLDQSEGTGDQSARSALSIAIQRTTTIISTLDTIDPATFPTVISDQQASLQRASQAVLGNQGTRCDNGVEVPAGINPMVCQAMPASAIRTVASGGLSTYTQFSMPSGNVGCTKDAYGAGMICEIIRKDWTLPADLVPACGTAASSCGSPEPAITDGVVTSIRHSDVAPWVSNSSDSTAVIPVLEYGQVADFSPVACLSDQNGVVCWDTATHHGFQMNVDWFAYW